MWVGVFALLFGFATFLDEFYLSEQTKSRLRGFFVRLVARLDPDQSAGDVRDIFSGLPTMFGELIAMVFVLAATLGLGFVAVHNDVLAIILLPIVAILVTMSCLYIFALGPFVVLLSLLIISIGMFKLIRWILGHIAQKSSDPKKSPFKYICLLGGLWLLVAKLVIEIAK